MTAEGFSNAPHHHNDNPFSPIQSPPNFQNDRGGGANARCKKRKNKTLKSKINHLAVNGGVEKKKLQKMSATAEGEGSESGGELEKRDPPIEGDHCLKSKMGKRVVATRYHPGLFFF